MLRTQHILAIIAVCVNCALLHSKLTQSLTDKIHKHLSSHIDSDPGSRSSLAGWFWLRVAHEAAVIWQLAWSWRILGRRPQFLIVWISLQGCLTVLTQWLSAFPGASDPRERKRTLCLSWPSLEVLHTTNSTQTCFSKVSHEACFHWRRLEIESTFWTASKCLWKHHSDAEGPAGAGQAERVLSLTSADSLSTMV